MGLSASTNLLSSPTAHATTNVDDFYFSNYIVDYYLSRAEDGTSRLHVVEKFAAEFPEYDQNRGFIRSIAATNNKGANVTIPDVVSLNLTATRNGDSSKVVDKIVYNRDAETYDVYLQDPNAYVHGHQLYTLEYDMSNVITGVGYGGKTYSYRDQAEIYQQEFYWDTNGTEWFQRFEHLTANVHFVGMDLSEVLDPKMLAAHAAGATTGTHCYTGYYGEDGQNCAITTLEDGYSFQATTTLNRGENLTLAITLKADAFALPVYVVTFKDFLPLIFWGVIILIFVILFFIIWRRHRKLTRENRQYYKSLLKPVQYLPPKDLSVSQAAYFVLDHRAKASAVNTLLELAVRHKIELIKAPSQRLFHKMTWQIRVKSLDGLNKSEKAILQLAGDGDDEPKVGDVLTLKTRPTSARRAALATLARTDDKIVLRKLKLLKSQSALAKTSSGGTRWVVLLIILISFLIPGYAYIYETIFGEVDMFGIMVVMVLMATILLTMRSLINENDSPYAQMTQRGMEMVAYMDGLRQYIKLAEADRLEFLQSVKGADTTPQGVVKLYERLLPYAALFGYEKSWLKELGHYYANLNTAPVWYDDTTNVSLGAAAFFTFSDFSHLRHISNTSIASYSSIGSSSGSGGSSSGFSGGGGGGFSGGGGGGGGGRGL